MNENRYCYQCGNKHDYSDNIPATRKPFLCDSCQAWKEAEELGEAKIAEKETEICKLLHENAKLKNCANCSQFGWDKELGFFECFERNKGDHDPHNEFGAPFIFRKVSDFAPCDNWRAK